MSLLSSIVIPMIERELAQAAPEISEALLKQIKVLGSLMVEWAESKLNVDINGDGIIGDADEKPSEA